MGNIDLIKIVEVGEEFVTSYDTFDFDPDKELALVCLLHIESILDKGRGFVDSESRTEINKRMDTLREKISEIISKYDPQEIKELLDQSARSFSVRFRPQ